MRGDWVMMVLVQTSLWVFYALIPWLALRRRISREVWPVQLVLAVLAGVVSQTVLGWIWSLWIQQPAGVEGIIYVGFWGWMIPVFWKRKQDRESFERQRLLTPFDHITLFGILLIGLTVRLLHPLDLCALGQSDAYTHLAMFREMAANGSLGNAAYPPGYAWIMTMPASMFHIDPYHMARFGGAFWGVALSFSVYFFLRKGCGDKRAALSASFLVACFPGFSLLLKTGIGAFANQVGLFLLPLVFAGLLLAGSRSRRIQGFVVTGLALAGMALSTPMMLLHAGLVIGLYMSLYGNRIWRLFSSQRLRWLWLLVPVLLLGGTVLLRFGTHTLSMTARILTGADEAAAANLAAETLPAWTSIQLLLHDFFTVKRFGLGSPLMDSLLAILFFIFLAATLLGVRRKKASWVLLGCWGGLASLQTATGFLQFTAYQREGWSLLVMTACLGGLGIAWIWIRFRPIRSLIALGLVVSAGMTLWHPPAHRLTNSTAEETMVRMARMLRAYPEIQPFSDSSMKGISGFLHARLIRDESLSLITRPLLQDSMLSAVAGPNNQLSVSKWDIYLDSEFGLNQSPQALILLDHSDHQDVEQLGHFADISPLAAENFLRQQQISYELNDHIESYLQGLSSHDWQVTRYDVSPRLSVFHVSRNQIMEEGE